MKVLHIASGDLWAGAEKQLSVLLAALNEIDDIELAAVIYNPGRLAEELKSLDIEVLELNETLQNPVALGLKTRRFIKKFAPEVIHTHRSKENIIASFASIGLGTQGVRTQHGANESASDRFNARQHIIHSLKKLVDQLYFKQIITVNDELTDYFQKKYTASKITLIPNGIDINQSTTTKSEKHHSDWKIGIVGRVVPLKRHDIFLETAEILLGQNDNNFCFKIIGDGPKQAEIQALARSKGITDHIQFLGHVDNAEAEIAALDIMLICSDHEGLPMVALEAMKSNTVVIAHAVGALNQLLDDGCGILLKQQTASAFASAIKQIIVSKAYTEIAVKAKQRIIDHYSATAMAEQYQKCYQALLNSPA